MINELPPTKCTPLNFKLEKLEPVFQQFSNTLCTNGGIINQVFFIVFLHILYGQQKEKLN